jgi:Ca2+/Na+ antiporter
MDQLNPFVDPKEQNAAQIIFYTLFFGYILYYASNLISDGSELLLLVPQFSAIIGSVVLPVLGAVPDGMMVLFSGMGADAQSQVSVGVGTLAGSTIMLLTLPWAVSVWFGRVNIDDGVPRYKVKKDKRLNDSGMSLVQKLGRTGVGIGDEIRDNAKIMLGTLIGYFVVQVPAFFWVIPKKGASPEQVQWDHHLEGGKERWLALLGLVVCMGEFSAYLWKMWDDANGEDSDAFDNKVADKQLEAIRTGQISLKAAMSQFMDCPWVEKIISGEIENVYKDYEAKRSLQQVCKVLAPFYNYYDKNKDGQIDQEEFSMIFHDAHENLPTESQRLIFKAADVDASNGITFEEFVACIMAWSLDRNGDFSALRSEKASTKVNPIASLHSIDPDDEGDDEDDDEEEDVPEDLADLPPEEQQRRLKNRASVKCGIGTLMLLVFSDPMVDLFAEIGSRIGISSFYVAFVLAPVTSNASELVAAYNYAVKKTQGAITTSLSTLVGAAIMNNTYCLGIFFTVIFVKDLAWEFTAETISILVIQLAMGAIILASENHTVLSALAILLLYPLAMAIVAVLESPLFGLD